ncbi:MAG: hypothetical protein Unbinned176contig1000_8 [Prokaryotic dsDNA virus sp.]|nr:MAG: hypothetical protein Unbinned176contig1000_8 [Prokaryotic dsDNA virus sp.]|tara:strand:+ start:5809 stop:6726 length:918 start_codon:yes stop_codon:yes gene_type:complete
MGYSITSNYSGEHAGQYIAAALKSSKSLEFLTVLENVKYKRNITKVANSGMIVDATCDFTDAGTLTLTERVLEPKALQINVDLCKKDLLADWQAAQMGAGAHNRDMSADFSAFVVSHLADTIADHVETNIWAGNSTASGEFVGFMHPTDGRFQTDTAIIEADNSGGAGAAYTATSIDDDLNAIVAAIPSAVYTKEDLYIYMSVASYRLYLQNQASAGYERLYNMGDGFKPMFNGIKIAVCPGMVDNKMAAAQKSNLFFGTDLVSDHAEIRMLDMSTLDGSDNVRVVAKFTAGCQHAQGGDIVRMD